MNILIENRQRKHPVNRRQLQKIARTILNASGSPDAELSVTIVGDRRIRQINRDYLGRDKTTNVISFAQQEGEGGGQSSLLGDVVISADTAARDAEEAGVTFLSELVFLLLHGTLHLLGYDHERSGEQEAARMEAREAELFGMLKREFPEIFAGS